MRRAPLSPLRILAQVVSTPLPSGVTMPRPVTTTRLIECTPDRIRTAKTARRRAAARQPADLRQCEARALALRVLFEKLGGVADGENGLSRVIRDFAAELFLERHDEF